MHECMCVNACVRMHVCRRVCKQAQHFLTTRLLHRTPRQTRLHCRSHCHTNEFGISCHDCLARLHMHSSRLHRFFRTSIHIHAFHTTSLSVSHTSHSHISLTWYHIPLIPSHTRTSLSEHLSLHHRSFSSASSDIPMARLLSCLSIHTHCSRIPPLSRSLSLFSLPHSATHTLNPDHTTHTHMLIYH